MQGVGRGQGSSELIDAESPTKLIMHAEDTAMYCASAQSLPYSTPGAVSWPLRHLTSRYALHLSLFVLTGSASSSCFDIGITSLQSSTKAGLFTNTCSCSGF